MTRKRYSWFYRCFASPPSPGNGDGLVLPRSPSPSTTVSQLPNLTISSPPSSGNGGGLISPPSPSPSTTVFPLPNLTTSSPPSSGHGGGLVLSPSPSPSTDVVPSIVYPRLLTPGEESALDPALRELLTTISDKLRAMKVLKSKSVRHEGGVSPFYLDFWREHTVNWNDRKEVLNEGMDFVDSLEKYISKQGNKDVTHAIVPFLQKVGEFHWITSALFLVGKAIERWELVTKNKEESLRLMEEMVGLAALLIQIRERKIDNPNMQAFIKEAVEKLIRGCVVCCYQISSSRLRGMLVATYDKGRLSELRQEIEITYRNITSHMTVCIYDAITCINKTLARPRNVMYPEHAVGIDEQVAEIIKVLDYESDINALAVVLHMFGGMGKTTVADAVFASLDIKDCRYSMVQLFRDTKSIPDIVKLQKTIIADLTGKQPTGIETYQEGQKEIEKILKDFNAFIYIDNVLVSENSDELEHLLPQELSSAKKTRLLITTRDSTLVCTNLTSSSCETKVYSVQGIACEFARYLIRKGCNNRLSETEITDLVEMCRGVPLLVKLVANFIKSYRPESHEKDAYKVVKHRYQNNFTPNGHKKLSEEFAIETLDHECRECFFDICCFFVGHSWHEMKMAYGEDILETLQSRALISLDSFGERSSIEGTFPEEQRFGERYSVPMMFSEGIVHVHDVLIDIARRSSAETRLNSIIRVREIIDKSDNRKKINIKGLQCDDDGISISAKDIDQLHGCLRVLDLPAVDVEGRCLSSFPHIKFLSILKLSLFQHRHTHLEQLPNLRVLLCRSYVKQTLLVFLSQLQYLECNCLEFSENISDLLPSLRSLCVRDCSDLETLPEDIGCLSCLESLWLNCCNSIEALPASLVNLASLRSLSLTGLNSIESIPDDLFHSMLSLIYLGLSMKKIRKLPCKINCPLLVVLNLSDSDKLEELPESICNLSQLRVLNLENCRKLKKLPPGIGRLTCLVGLDLSGCLELQELPQSFGDLHLLQTLFLKRCVSLKSLPRGFGRLRSLHKLTMLGCHNLEELCSDFDQLQSLTTLNLVDCPMLRGECLDLITKLPSLVKAKISGSNYLMKKWILGSSHYRKYNSIKFDLRKAMYMDLFDCFILVGKDGQRHFIDGYIPFLITVESSSDPKKLEYLKSALSQIDRRVPLIHFGDRCDDWPQEIEDAIVARAPSDSIAYLLWTHCSQEFMGSPNNVDNGLIVAYVRSDYLGGKMRRWEAFGEESMVRMSTHYLNMAKIYYNSTMSFNMVNKGQIIWLLKQLMESRKMEDGTPQVKLQRCNNGGDVLVEDLEGKDVYIVAFPSNFLQNFGDMDKEKFCRRCQLVAQQQSEDVICTKRGDASDQFSQWTMSNIPDCILLESLDLLTAHAIQFLFHHKDSIFRSEDEIDDEAIWVFRISIYRE